jgi:hypothetical protein
MIEFKGDCGHLIRARDEDLGKVVRCSYCGKEAVVVRAGGAHDPESDLLDAVEQTGEYDAYATKAVRKSHKARKRAEKRLAKGKSANVDPFAVILKMTYVAVVIVIGAVVWKYVPGLYESLTGNSGPSPTPDGGGQVVQATPQATPPAGPVSASKHGLLTDRLDIHPQGVYVASVPESALIFHATGWGLGEQVLTDKDATQERRAPGAVKLAAGRHTVAVAVRINDPGLMRMPGYRELRRALEANAGRDASKRMAAYFMPDDHVAQTLVRIGKYQYLVRIYEVDVDGMWLAITALFLPRADLSAVMAHLPAQTRFGFSRADVERELAFYEVSREDTRLLLDALARIGRMGYRHEPDGPYRMFQIDPVDGAITSEQLGY